MSWWRIRTALRASIGKRGKGAVDDEASSGEAKTQPAVSYLLSKLYQGAQVVGIEEKIVISFE